MPYQCGTPFQSSTAERPFRKNRSLFEEVAGTCRETYISLYTKQCCVLNAKKKPLHWWIHKSFDPDNRGINTVCYHLPHVRFYLIMSTPPLKSEDKLEKSPISTDQLQASSTTSNYDDLYDDISPELQSLASRKESHRASERVYGNWSVIIPRNVEKDWVWVWQLWTP